MPTTIPSPIGFLTLQLSESKLSGIDYATTSTPSTSSQNKIIQVICDELAAYFKNPSHSFTIPLHLHGTPFQQRVWEALRRIPSGTTLTYGDLAKQLHTSPRAIGNACRANPIPIIIPCHRILAKNHLGGYTGKTNGKMLAIKQWLLQHENR